MDKIKNPLELYRFLKKTNCGQCLLPSCMAFSVAVIQGRKPLADCPYLDREALARLAGKIAKRASFEVYREEVLAELRGAIAGIDFAAAEARLEAVLVDNKLSITCLGKEFQIDRGGSMFSECHINTWIHVPLLHYVVHCKGMPLTGEWVGFNELKFSAEWGQFFGHRVEEPFRQLADAHPELVFEILDVLGACDPGNPVSADRSLVVLPLPRVPFLINYWQPEEGFDSKLSILFDRSADRNLNAESVYLLGRGMVEMIRQLIVRHSRDGKLF